MALTGTEIPDLERSNNFTVKALSMYQLTLQGEQSDNNKPLDTSMGHLHLKFPHAFCSAGLWRCPLIWWYLLFLAATVGAVSQLNWCLELLVCGLGLCTGALAFAWRFGLGGAWQDCTFATSKPMLKFIEGSLEVKLPTIWRDEKQSRAEAQRRGRLEERR